MIRYNCLKIACKSKTAGHGVKSTAIWDPGTLATYMFGIFDLVVFRVIVGWWDSLNGSETYVSGVPIQRIWGASVPRVCQYYCVHLLLGINLTWAAPAHDK